MNIRPIISVAIGTVLSIVFRSPIPIGVIGVLFLICGAIRDSKYGVRRPSYRDRYLTDSIAPDGSTTNLRGEPYCPNDGFASPEKIDALLSASEAHQRKIHTARMEAIRTNGGTSGGSPGMLEFERTRQK